MSKPQKKQNSWSYIQGRCLDIFGPERFSADEKALYFTFDLSVPSQRHEHDGLVQTLQKEGIACKISTDCKQIPGSHLLISQSNMIRITMQKETVDRDALNRCLLPFVEYSQLALETRRYRKDPIIKRLAMLTERPWVRQVPSPYSKDMIYTPAEGQPGLSEERRAEQQSTIAEAFVPKRRRPGLRNGNWIEYQQSVERELSLTPATAIPTNFLLDDREARAHQKRLLEDRSFRERVKAVFSPSSGNTRE